MSSDADSVSADATAAAAAAAAAAARKFNIELWTLYAVGVCMTLLRTYAQWNAVGWRGMHVDDFLVWVAIVCLSFVLCLYHLSAINH